MVVAQSPLSNSNHQRPKSNRKPLQPKNTTLATPNTNTPKLKPKFLESNFEISPFNDNSNKENVPPGMIFSTPVKSESLALQIESLDSSLGDKLSAIRERIERVKIDKDKTDDMLKERGSFLDFHLKEIIERGEVQKMLEIEVDRLYRLKELKLACLRVSPIRSLRDKEQEKKINQDKLKANIKFEDSDGQIDESPLLESPKIVKTKEDATSAYKPEAEKPSSIS